MEYDYDSPNTYVGTFGDNTKQYAWAGDGFRAPVTGSSFIYYTGKGTYDLQSYTLSLSDLLGRVKVNARAGLMLGEDRYTLASATSSQYTYWDAPGSMKITQNQTWFGEMTGDIPFLNEHVVTVGASYRLDSSDTNDYTIPYYRSYDNPSGSVSYVGGKAQNIGIFVQEEWHPVDVFRLYLGARVDIWKGMDGQMKDYETSAFQNFEDSTKTSFSPKIAAVYQPFEGTSIRASVGKSFRAPTVYELYRTWVSSGKEYHPNPYLDPETVWTYELGWEQVLFNKKTTASISVFYNDIQDLIYSSTVGTNVYKKNAGCARTFGVVLGARHQLFSWISLFGNFTYTDAKIESNPTDLKSEG
jgi:iron complex outermembrane receptor protein